MGPYIFFCSLFLFPFIIPSTCYNEKQARVRRAPVLYVDHVIRKFPFIFPLPFLFSLLFFASSTHYRLLLLCCILFNMDFVYFSFSIRAISITSHMLLACSRRLLIINIIIVTLNYPFVYLFIALLISVQQQLISCFIISCSVSFFIIPSYFPLLFCVFRHISLGCSISLASQRKSIFLPSRGSVKWLL